MAWEFENERWGILWRTKVLQVFLKNHLNINTWRPFLVHKGLLIDEFPLRIQFFHQKWEMDWLTNIFSNSIEYWLWLLKIFIFSELKKMMPTWGTQLARYSRRRNWLGDPHSLVIYRMSVGEDSKAGTMGQAQDLNVRERYLDLHLVSGSY